MKTSIILLASLSTQLCGCAMLSNADKLAPIPTVREYATTFADRLKEAGGQGKPTLPEFKTGLVKMIGEYHGYAATRRQIEWDSSGLTTYGGLGAVVGALAHRTGLTNVGAAVAGLGLATSSRYNFAQQSIIYVNSVKKLSCINSKVAFIPETIFDDAKLSDDVNAATIAKGAVDQLVFGVESVRIEASSGVMALVPATPTRDELLTMMKSYRPAEAPAAPGANAAPEVPPSAAMLRQREAGEQVKTLLSEAALCIK